jgi:predicted enzyme related to lactoylglutathione lyase
MTRAAEIALFTDDVASVRAFYEHLLGTSPEEEWPGGAMFVAGDVKVLVHERAGAMDDAPLNEDHFAFAVGDLDSACADLQSNGIEVLVEPRDYPWGRSAYLRDPDGRFLELSQE